MKILGVIFFLATTLCSCSQINVRNQYNKADSLLQSDNFSEAYTIFKELNGKCEKTDPLYDAILLRYLIATNHLVSIHFADTDWKNTLDYSLEALTLIQESKSILDTLYLGTKYMVIKNIIVSYFGLGQIDKATIYQDELYAGYKERTLPDFLDGFYNFEFFKFENKNIWGYECYTEECIAPDIKRSFKIMYYVYSTNPDGTDKYLLYALQVRTLHKNDHSKNFDYVLSKSTETPINEENETLFSYAYTKPIDYIKLRADIREVVKGNYKPGIKTIIKKN